MSKKPKQPHNIEAEESVLGALLIDPLAYANVATILEPDDFYLQKNAWIYEAMRNLHNRGVQVDPTTICDELERHERLEPVGGSAYVTGLIAVAPNALHAKEYAQIVSVKASRRRLLNAASEVAMLAYNEELGIDETQARAETAILDARRNTGGLVTASEGARGLWDDIEDWQENPAEIRGLSTGLTPLDKTIGGLEAGLYVLAARPSIGKTAMGLQIASNVAQRGRKVIFFTLEMSVKKLYERLASSLAKVSLDRVRRGKASSEELQALAQELGEFSECQFMIHTGVVTAGDIRAIVQRESLRDEVALVVVDYLGLMASAKRAETRNLELGAIARSLLLAANDLDVPIIAIHQLNRSVEMRADKRPLLSDLRESGQIEEHADVVLMLYREGYYNPDSELANVMEVWVRKNRLGGPADRRCDMYWHGEYMRCEPLTQQSYNPTEL
jgi:replicative DNA helicase